VVREKSKATLVCYNNPIKYNSNLENTSTMVIDTLLYIYMPFIVISNMFKTKHKIQ